MLLSERRGASTDAPKWEDRRGASTDAPKWEERSQHGCS